MSSIIILINNTQNPKGRSLVQIGSTLIVNTECCGSGITKRDVGVGYDDYCDNCGRIIGFNKVGWGSKVTGISPESSGKLGASRWAEWALHWFGLEDFEIKVTE